MTSIGIYAFYGCTGLTIHGYTGSTAQTYASENNIPFIALGAASETDPSRQRTTGQTVSDAGSTSSAPVGQSATVQTPAAPTQTDASSQTNATENASTASPDTTAADAQQSDASAAKAPAKGTKLTSGKNVYKVTKSSATAGTVEYTKTTNTKAASLTIPATVKIDGVTYKVTSIAANTFSQNTKLKKVTIGKNITKIGKKAFYGCKNLKTITIKSTGLKTVGANALKGIHAKAKITVPKKQLSTYKKLLKGKGQGKKVTVKA